MMTHDKISFAREYCRCRRIPYRFKKETLFIDGFPVFYSIYNIRYTEIVRIIDESVVYNEMGFYDYLSVSF